MKKLAAIFLLTTFLYNSIGYRIIFFYAQHKSDIQLEASLDKNDYNEAELVTIKIPLSMPYITDQKKFERIDGEVSFNGKLYKYVKRRIASGQLILLCLPHYNKMRLAKAKNDFFKDANDINPGAGSKKENPKGSAFKNILTEYDQVETRYSVILLTASLSSFISTQVAALLSTPHASPEQPPEWDNAYL